MKKKLKNSNKLILSKCNKIHEKCLSATIFDIEDISTNTKDLSFPGAGRSGLPVAAHVGWREKSASGNPFLHPKSFIFPRG